MNYSYNSKKTTQDILKCIDRQKNSRFSFYSFGTVGNIAIKWILSVITFYVVTILLPMNFIVNIMENYILLGLAIGIIVIIIGVFFAVEKFRKNQYIPPYGSSENFSSVYSVDDLTKDNKLDRRVKEVDYISRRLCEISNQADEKNILLLTGESGSGKSTLLWLVENYKTENIFNSKIKEYEEQNKLPNSKFDINRIYRFSSQYNDFENSLLRGINIALGGGMGFAEYSDAIEKLESTLSNDEWDNGRGRPLVLVFDQFENFFTSLKEEKKEQAIEQFFMKLSMKNIAVIFSIRDDKLSLFLSEFNFVLQKRDKIEKENGIIAFQDSVIVHNENKNSVLLFTQNDNPNSYKQFETKCDNAFIELKANDDIKNLLKDSVMIERQMICSVLEQDKDARMSKLFDKDNLNISIILSRYFDRQLSSTGNFFEALQIMYLLSSGGNANRTVGVKANQISGKKANKAFSATQIGEMLFYRDNKDSIESESSVLNRLVKLRLVKKLDTSPLLYEVTHDYIADKFLEYSVNVLNPEMRSNIDNFKDNCCCVHGVVNEIINMQENKEKTQKNSWGLIVIAAIVISVNTIFSDKIGDVFEIILLTTAALLSMGYAWALHVNAFCANPTKGMRNLSWIFLVALPVCGYVAAVITNRFIIIDTKMIDFLANIIAVEIKFYSMFIILGFTFCLLAFYPLFIVSRDRNLNEGSQKFFKGVGIRLLPGGCAIILATFIVLGDNFIGGIILYLLLIVYGYFTHIHKVYYSRIIGMFANRKINIEVKTE
ncbi:MAG: hypothetical protein FWE14_02935 [Lachnospiraceae bacterium]|nr:hypothetical protein [Lachnospiraceae bacterium]